MTAKLTVDESDVRTAHKLVWDVKAASVSILQRHLCLGYLRAGAIIDELERRGIVGPADVNGFKIPRRVLVAPEGCGVPEPLPTPDRPAVGTDAVEWFGDHPLVHHLRDLISQWKETISLNRADQDMCWGYSECIGELEQILAGDLSPIERMPKREGACLPSAANTRLDRQEEAK
jgi:hypothetical protein